MKRAACVLLAVAYWYGSAEAGGHRSSKARREFMKITGYPHGRPGYVIDHIIPIKRGGCDCAANMQWQTVAEGKAKDRKE